jgi:hypothetical protein
MVWEQTKNVAQTADVLGCSRRVVYHHLRRAGIPARPYIRKPVLYLVRDAFTEWQAARKRAIDVELVRLRLGWQRELDRAATNGRNT